MNKSIILAFLLCFALTPLFCADASEYQDKGQVRLRRLRQLTAASSNSIIDFSYDEFKEYAMSYPRPYDLVLYFTAPGCKLCEELQPEYDYMAELYYQQGAITAEKNPTFFVKVMYSRAATQLYEMFGFSTAPNLVVSEPYMAVVSEVEKKRYFQKIKWAISHSDGHVTCHKMLEFTNKRTDRDIIYKPTLKTMLQTFFGFVAVAAIGVYVYLNMKSVWTNWMVWFGGSMLIYVVCVSGVVYDIIHDVPFVGRDPKTGEAVVFAGGNRQQYGAEGFIISFLLSGIGMLFIAIFTIGAKLPKGVNRAFCFAALLTIVFLVFALEDGYKSKSWYGPSFSPPADYQMGPISSDQGNNI